jgi:hypothetical protein
MKKLSFIFALVFAASMAMAQTAVINQTSVISDPQSQQLANVDQTGLSTVNIMQNADKVTTPLPGTAKAFDHTATATQSGGNINAINITQIAQGNVYGTTVEKNVAEATQVGNWNTMNQTQISGDWTSGGMDFTALQKGDGNTGTQYGKKTSSDFDLYQKGNNNTSYQGTTGEKTGVLVGDVKQIGDWNKATQLFHGENVRYAGASIDQKGTSNTATQEFSSLITLWNDPSHAEIIQRNSGNTAYQSQVGQGSYQLTEQYGSNNNATLKSSGNFNNTYTLQDGTNGIIFVDQKQTAGLASPTTGNLAKISQKGNHSEAYIMQDGMQNKVVGLSDDNYAINNNDSYLNVSQTGVGNLVRSSQVVSTASETVVQMGNANTAIVNQH